MNFFDNPQFYIRFFDIVVVYDSDIKEAELDSSIDCIILSQKKINLLKVVKVTINNSLEKIHSANSVYFRLIKTIIYLVYLMIS